MEAGQLEVAVQAAYSTVAVLHNLGVPCALFGGMACYLYGNTRVPKVRLSFLLRTLGLSLCRSMEEKGSRDVITSSLSCMYRTLTYLPFRLGEVKTAQQRSSNCPSCNGIPRASSFARLDILHPRIRSFGTGGHWAFTVIPRSTNAKSISSYLAPFISQPYDRSSCE